MRKTPVVLVTLVAALVGCQEKGKKPMAAETQIKLDLPAVPDFTIPQPLPDGSHTVAEVRLRSAKLLDQQIKITGYVVAHYNLETCARDLGGKKVQAEPKLCDGKGDIGACSLAVGKKIVEDTPNLCERPYIYLADTPSATAEKSVWVVEVPRPLRPDEVTDPLMVEAYKKNPAPTIAVGQKVVITGKWMIKSPLGFGNSDGLLVYESLLPST
jgi:hypothetical protein